jgi:hypothetical protein
MPKVTINIRYTAKHKRITSKIPEHYKGLTSLTTFRNYTFNSEALRKVMGTPPERFTRIVTGKGEPTLGEAAAYAAYFQIDINELFEVAPAVKQLRRRAA